MQPPGHEAVHNSKTPMSDAGRDWFYVGHYGQLGPLTSEQMEELARDGVIASDTYVWSTGMSDWRPAGDTKELQGIVAKPAAEYEPPPFMPSGAPTANAPVSPANPAQPVASINTPMFGVGGPWGLNNLPVSDKSRVTAGLLSFIPGAGRLYLGYSAHGLLQILLFLFGCGIGWLWSIGDAIYILSGGLKLDGYGRRLPD